MSSQPTGVESDREIQERREGWLTARSVLVAAGVVVGVAAALILLWLSRRIITWLLIAAFLAVALNPAVELLVRYARMRRGLAITVVYLLGAGAVTGVAMLFVPPLLDAGQALVDDAPSYIDRLRDTDLFRTLDERYNLLDRVQKGIEEIPDRLGAGAAVDLVRRLFAGIFGTLTVLVLTFFFLLYGTQMRESALRSLGPGPRQRWRDVTDRMYATIGGYVRGNLLISVIAGVTAYIVLLVCGVPFAPALAFWVAITDLLPLIGATIGAVPCVAVAYFQGWVVGTIVTGYFVLYQQIENHLVQPAVMRRTTSLNPLVVLVAVLLGAELLGVLGALVAIPVAGMIQILVQDGLEHRRSRARAMVLSPPPRGPD